MEIACLYHFAAPFVDPKLFGGSGGSNSYGSVPTTLGYLKYHSSELIDKMFGFGK